MATAAAADALTAPPARPVPADTAELVPDEAADAAVAPDAPVATEPKSSRTASPFLPILISGRRHDHADGRQTTYSGRAQLPGGQRLHDSTQRRGTYPTQPTVRQRSGARARSPPHPRHREDGAPLRPPRSEEHTSELQSHVNLVCRLLLEKKNDVEIQVLVIKHYRSSNCQEKKI